MSIDENQVVTFHQDPIFGGTTPTITLGDGGAEDTALIYDGNAQDFYIGLDDSADDLVIGLGSTVGTTPAISINSDRDVTISDGAIDFDIASHDTSNGLKLGGTLVTATAAELNIMDGVTATAAELNIMDGVTSTAAELNIMDGVTSTASEINLIDGGTARGTTAVASGDGLLVNDAGTMRMTNVDTVSTYFASHSVGGSNIVTTGALNSGSITSGFGTIDTGSSAITTTGLISGGSLDIDNVLIDGSTIGHTDDTDLITVADSALTIAGDVVVSGTTPKVTIGDAGAEDSMLAFDGNALDFHIALDDSADDLVIGTGTTAGTATLISINGDGSETKFNQPKITLGDGTAEDTYFNFDGNAQDFRIGIDDGTDKLEIGAGTAHGTTAALTIDSSANVTFGAKLIMPDVTAGKFLVGDGTSYEEVAMSGDATLASGGALTIAANSVDGTMIALGSDAQGDVMYYNGTNWARLAAGTDGHFLKTQGASANPVWAAGASGGASDIDGLSDALVENNSIWLGNDPSGTTDTASFSVAVGTTALDAITTGDSNTAIGYDALSVDTSGNQNTAVGAYALDANTTGALLVAVGKSALSANTTANNNVAVGYAAGLAITTGASNVSVGNNTLEAVTTTSNNVAVGDGALRYHTGANCVSVGMQSSHYVTGNTNTAIGYQALLGASGSSSGTNNVAVGANALDANTTASNNVACGQDALTDNTTGANNTAVGWAALADNTTAANNTTVGYYSLRAVTTGTTNAALGGNAGQAVTTGSEVCHIGQNAGTSPTTGNGTTCIGYNANSTSATVQHEMTLGNANLGTLRCQQTSITALSDERDKKQIEDMPEEGGLDFINKLKPRTFYWDMREWYDDGVNDGSKMKPVHRSWKPNSGQRMGFISQEVQSAIEGLKYMEDSKIVSGTPEKLEFAPAHLITPLIKAVQQLSAEVESLKTQLEES